MPTQGGFVTSVINWFAHPFNTKGTVLNWFLFVGIIVIAAFAWSTVVNQITE